MKRVLVLAGATEARALCAALAERDDVEGIASLAGATEKPAAYAGAVRVGGFGGATGLAAYLRDERIDALIDATHPFAAQISANARRAAEETGVPLLRLERLAWARRPEERWTEVASVEEAAAALPAGARAFLATGRKTLSLFAARADVGFTARVVDRPAETPRNVELVVARPPFALADEIDLLRARAVTHLVTKNAGGAEGRAKLDAAAALGLPVIMVARPPLPHPAPETVATVPAALLWLDAALLWLDGPAASQTR